ncbi:cation transporter [Tepidimonas taiwanensis]|uniref:Copper chaperone CopZ n=1 Tax=Tepidimonas taiwanensis TaxID=307486 RepID=A0A554X5G7_9BURK|nr:cation transporter [Tepidimonas taiwanensis]MCX7693905.1 cation transporter [Tepidimonas taiwanensis]MDM7463958.1 cation transporter [Tepidimonas taiwanensis]TSE31074.1 Copper chaperone CopZ [Tepidimonas taiwanensis]UBQ05266.1 cation transporter [Tepidimonas taiwanensis]
MQHVFTVDGMSCGHCVKAITQAIRALDPQAQVRVDLDERRVEVESDRSRVALADAIRDEGYTVRD